MPDIISKTPPVFLDPEKYQSVMNSCFDFSPHETSNSAISARQNGVNFFIIKDFGLHKDSENYINVYNT